MRRADAIVAISAHREDIARRFGVRSLSLFGSVARDEARPDSDVDLVVEFEGPTTFDGHMGLLVFLEDLLGRRVDVVTAKGLSLASCRSLIRTSRVSRDALLYVAAGRTHRSARSVRTWTLERQPPARIRHSDQ